MKKNILLLTRVMVLSVLIFSQVFTPIASASPVIASPAKAAAAETSTNTWKAAPGPEPSIKGYTIASQENFKASDPSSAVVSGPITANAGVQTNTSSASALLKPLHSAPASTYNFASGLTIEPLSAYNLIVDSNVLTPASYGPNTATLGAKVCNTNTSGSLNDVWAYIGSYNGGTGSTPGTYPVHSPATDPNFYTTYPTLWGTSGSPTPPTSVDYGDPARFFALKQESGSMTPSADASRYIGSLAAGECKTQYWLVSYPRKACYTGSVCDVNNSSRKDVTGDVKPQDDLWLQYDFWAMSGSNTSWYTRYVTMRNEISANPNKIWPNGDNKVPDEYIEAIRLALGWSTWTPNGASPLEAFPGETVTTQGIWYDFGNVGAGFDNDYDLVPDRNAWIQPVGDASSFDPGCFRMFKVYGLVIVKLTDGTDMLIPFVDQMYFTNIPGDNNGAVGLVFYDYVAKRGPCVSALTPYQEIASGYDNEKFNADYGAGLPPLTTKNTNMTFDKNGPVSVALGGTINYSLTFTLPDVSPSNNMIVMIGSPSTGNSLTYVDAVPVGLQYVNNSASPNATMTNYGSVTSIPVTRLYSLDGGSSWSTTEPPANYTSTSDSNQLVIKWLLSQGINSPDNGPAVTGTVGFSAIPPSATYTSKQVDNTACMAIGEAPGFVCDPHKTLITGNSVIGGTVWRDDAITSGIIGNALQDGTEQGIPNVTVSLYWDNNGDGDYTDSGDFLYATTQSMNYSVISNGTNGGYIDVNGSGTITSDGLDNATLTGVNVINGMLDIDGNGTVNSSDNGFFGEWAVIGGLIDINRSGTMTTADTGTLKGVYDFSSLPAAPSTGTPRYLIAVDIYDSDIPSGYGPDTPTSYTKVALAAASAYGDAIDGSEPSDFGFVPALSLDKRVATVGTILVGDTIKYTIALTNNIPGSGTGSSTCSYTLWTKTDYPTTGATPPGGGPTNSQFVNPDNVLGPPDENFAYSFVSDNNDKIGLSGYNTGNLGGNIISVKYVFHVHERIDLSAKDSIIIRPYYNDNTLTSNEIQYFGDGTWTINKVAQTPTTYFSGGTSSAYDITGTLSPNAITGRTDNTWRWTDFTNNLMELQLEANKGSTNPNGDVDVDAAGFIITTDGVCDSSQTTLNPVPLTDVFSSSYFSFVSSDPPISSASTASGTTTLTWNNVGPIFPGQTRIVTVLAKGLQTGTTTATDNTATSTNSMFTSGRPANTPVSDVATVTITANTGTRSITGVVFDDNNTNGWQTALWTRTNAVTGYDSGDVGIPYIPVDLYACVDNTGALITTEGTNKTCTDQGGHWSLLKTTSTMNYNVISNGTTGGYIDINGSGTITSADSASLSGVNVIAGALDINGDGSITATDDGSFGGYTVIDGLLDMNASGTITTADTGNLKGVYNFGNLAQGYYRVHVNSSLVDGSETADVTENGTCTTCDSWSNAEYDNLSATTFVGDLDNYTAQTRVNFGYNILNSGTTYNIGDQLFYDWNGDGLMTSGVDEGIYNVTMRLLAADGTQIATTTTDRSGLYAFNGYYPAYYTVQVDTNTLPAGWSQSYDPDSTKDNQSTFALVNQNDYTRDFGYKPAGLGTIGDTVFKDMNGDGVQNSAGDTGISGVTVELQVDLNGDGTYVTVATKTTNSTGYYLFTGLPYAAYRVKIDLDNTPYANSTAIPNDTYGNDYYPSNGTTSTAGMVYMTRTLSSGNPNDLTADFGFAPPASIGDTVYQDINGDGTQDLTEPGIPGVTVRLYSFTDLGDGDGVYDTGEPYYDLNGNGAHDAGEPFFDRDGRYQPGDTLGAQVGTSATTDSNGRYLFSNLAPGYYVVVVDTTSAPLTNATLTGDPNTDGISCLELTKSPPATPPSTDPPSTICDSRDGQRLYNNTNYMGADFGYRLSGAFGDRVWIDTDNDGISDQTEEGIARITVNATTTVPAGATVVVGSTTYNAGQAINLSTETDANGYYTFKNITTTAQLTWTVTVNTSDTDFPAGMSNTYDPDSVKNSSTTLNMNTSGAITDVGGCTTTPNGCDGESDPLNLDADFGYRYAGPTTLSGTICLETATTANGYCGTSNTDPDGVGAGETAYDNVTVYLYKLDDLGDGDGVYDVGEPYTDTNHNGVHDAGEPFFDRDGALNPGETTTLVATTNTNATGDYTFLNVADGVYYIIAIGAPQTGLDMTSTQSTVNSGGDGSETTSYVETVGGDSSTISAYQVVHVVTGDTSVTDRDFSFKLNGSYDFGDLPETYATTLEGNPDGPRHLIAISPTLYLGSAGANQASLVDANGQPSVNANLDSSDNGVSIPVVSENNSWIDGTGKLQFDIVGSGWLTGWIDYNRDGDFADANEMVINQSVTSNQDQNLTITTPTTSLPNGGYYARFRLFPTQPAVAALAYSGASASGEVEDYKFFIMGGTPTPVTLSYFRAQRNGPSVDFEWTTATESGNMGFNLYVEENDGQIQINSELIPSKVTDSLDRQDYSYSLNVAGNTFYLEEVSVVGETHRYGPYQLGQEYGDQVAEDKIDQAAVKAEHSAKFADQQGALKKNMTVPSAALQAAVTGQTGMQLTTSLNLKVNKTGLYQVTYETLRDAGLDLAGVPIAKITLTNKGQMVPVYVEGTGKFGPSGFVEFYGQAQDTIYTDTNIYTLQVSKSPADRVQTNSAAVGKGLVSPATYTDTLLVNNQVSYVTYAPGDEAWYEKRMLVYKVPQTFDFNFQLNGLSNPSAAASLNLVVWGGADWAIDPDHHMLVSVNGVVLTNQYFDGLVEETLKLDLPAGTLHEGKNTLRLTLPGDTGADYDLVLMDKYSVTYQRSFQAQNGQITFTAATKAFTVTNLPSSNVIVYRMTSKGPVRLNQVTIQPSGSTFTASFAGTNQIDTYIVTTVEGLYKPVLEGVRLAADVSQPAQYLIISHPDFIAGLQPLVAAKQAQGLTVSVVDVTDLYTKYTYGIFDPRAIRQYIAYAAQNLGTQYVLLVGGDTYDYRNYLGKNSISFIPSLYMTTGSTAKFVPVDPLYADINGDNLPDLAIGRFPVRSTAELTLMVNKTLAYANKTYRRTDVFASDMYDGIVNYKSVSDAFAANVPSNWTTGNISLDGLPVGTARQQLLAAMNRGTAMVTFTGHSSPIQWASTNLFNTTYAAGLTNAGKPFVVVQWGCWNTYYVDPVNNYLVQKLLFSGDKGAAAVLGAYTLTDSWSEQMLGLLLTPRLTVPGMTIGRAVQESKAELAQTHPELLDVLLGWGLMGDPALVIEP